MLFLRFSLAGPLQSWGPPSPWDVKTTCMLPTKTGVVGLISACFGYTRGDPRIQELSDSIQMAVRADRPGSLLEDFQSVHSNKPYMVNASGKSRTSGSSGLATSIVIKRQYIQDARFTVFISGSENLLRSIYAAMKAPVFLTYLGRKNCVPTEPIVPAFVEAKNIHEALRSLTDEDRKEIGGHRVLVEVDAPAGIKGSLSQRMFSKRDRMVNGCNRNYAIRRVASYYVDM